MNNKIECPLMEEEIEDIICFDIHMVVEGISPKSELPNGVINIKNYEEQCKNCKNHRED